MSAKEDPLSCHDIIDDIECDALAELNVHLVIHYDPIVTDDPELDQMRQQVCAVLSQVDERLSIHDFRMVRGKGHSNLIFDITTPHDLLCKEQQIRESLKEGLVARCGTHYNTVITFDPDI